MTDNRAALESVNIAVLTEVVRQALRSPAFEVGTWGVKVLSDRGFLTPDGLWLVSGEGRDDAGPRQWSVVVKMLKRQEPEPPQDDVFYWKREPMLAQSGLTVDLPGQARAPRFYRVDERPEGDWVWMEHAADDRPGLWQLKDFAFAARQLGVWNGTYLAGKPMPNQPWLSRRLHRSWTAGINPEQDWQFSLLVKHCPAERRAQYDRLWADREIYFEALERLPQSWLHHDIQRRNIFIRRGEDGQDELMMVDWAFSGIGAVGAEVAQLVAMSSFLQEWPPAAAMELETAALAEYRRGLVESGWLVDEAALRLGYAAWVAISLGTIFPFFSVWLCSPESREFSLGQFGSAEEELFLRIWPAMEYALDRAEEARGLMK
jgi:hypothetical protein